MSTPLTPDLPPSSGYRLNQRVLVRRATQWVPGTILRPQSATLKSAAYVETDDGQRSHYALEDICAIEPTWAERFPDLAGQTWQVMQDPQSAADWCVYSMLEPEGTYYGDSYREFDARAIADALNRLNPEGREFP